MSIVRLPVGSLLKGDKTKKKRQTARQHDDGHLAFIRSLPCLVTGGKAEAAHIRFTSRIWGKDNPGVGCKPADRWAVPLCHEEHMAQHAHKDGEAAWWAEKGIDPLVIAARLFEASGDEQQALKIIRDARLLMKR